MQCNAQEKDIIFNKKTNKFELSLEAGIDQSIIASEWERLVDEVKRKDSIIAAKSLTIKKISEISETQLLEIESLTNVIVSQNQKISDISDNRVKTAKKIKNLFSVYGEVNTEPYNLMNIEFSSRAILDFQKIYLFSEASIVLNNTPRFDFGLGVKFF